MSDGRWIPKYFRKLTKLKVFAKRCVIYKRSSENLIFKVFRRPLRILSRSFPDVLEHRMPAHCFFRYGLNHVPMFDDFTVAVEAENIDDRFAPV